MVLVAPACTALAKLCSSFRIVELSVLVLEEAVFAVEVLDCEVAALSELWSAVAAV